MQKVALLVRLKIPDVTALTAANALRRSLGYSQLRALRRADYYGLTLAADTPEQALALATELAEKTNLFVNPNKHVFEVYSGQPAAPQAEGQVVQVLVTDPHDGSAEGMLAALQGRLGYGEVVSGVTRGLLWTLDLESDSPEAARQLAREIAETTSLEQGLLVNPHFQDLEIW